MNQNSLKKSLKDFGSFRRETMKLNESYMKKVLKEEYNKRINNFIVAGRILDWIKYEQFENPIININ